MDVAASLTVVEPPDAVAANAALASPQSPEPLPGAPPQDQTSAVRFHVIFVRQAPSPLVATAAAAAAAMLPADAYHHAGAGWADVAVTDGLVLSPPSSESLAGSVPPEYSIHAQNAAARMLSPPPPPLVRASPFSATPPNAPLQLQADGAWGATDVLMDGSPVAATMRGVRSPPLAWPGSPPAAASALQQQQPAPAPGARHPPNRPLLADRRKVQRVELSAPFLTSSSPSGGLEAGIFGPLPRLGPVTAPGPRLEPGMPKHGVFFTDDMPPPHWHFGVPDLATPNALAVRFAAAQGEPLAAAAPSYTPTEFPAVPDADSHRPEPARRRVKVRPLPARVSQRRPAFLSPRG